MIFTSRRNSKKISFDQKTMNKPLLNKQDEYPDDIVLEKYMGGTKPYWDEITSWVAAQFPSMAFEWRYYNDGKAYTLPMTANIRQKPIKG